MSCGITKKKASDDHKKYIFCGQCGNACLFNLKYQGDKNEYDTSRYFENIECHVCRNHVVPRARYCNHCKERSPIATVSQDQIDVATKETIQMFAAM